MDKTIEIKEKTLFELILFIYQLEIMLKNHNSLLKDKIVEGDLVSSGIAFNNSLIISSIRRILKDNPSLEEYSASDEFKERINSLVSGLKTDTKSMMN
jgi:hypothetical protein